MPSESLDALYTKVARKVLTETLHVQKGESVTVEAWDNGLPFARRVLAEARAMGCRAMLVYEDEEAYVEGVRRAPRDAIGKMGKNEYGMLAGTDAYVFVPGQALGVYSRTLKPKEREESTRYNSSWYEAAEKAGLRGARLTFGYVGRDMARFLGKKIEDVVRGQLKAVFADYGEIAGRARKVSSLLGDGAAVDLRTGNNELKFTLKGDLEIEDGVVDDEDRKTGNNMTYVPPGYVAKEIDPQSAIGEVTLADSLTKYGVVHRAELEFKNGALVKWRSEDGPKLRKLLDTLAPEKRKLTLLGIGLNPALGYGYGQDRFVRGAVTLAGFGFTGLVSKGRLNVGSSSIP
jgi:leucyl aminopeptidase (aminopeptidase T)